MAMQSVKEANEYGAAFRALMDHLRGEPAWLRSAREEAFAKFERIGFPTVHEEEWKYTNVAAIRKAGLTATPIGGKTGLTESNGLRPFLYDETRRSRLIFVNGVFQKELSSLDALPAGVIAMEFGEALASGQHEAKLREHFGRSTADSQNGFTALNTAFSSGGAFIFVPANTVVDVPVHLQFISESKEGEAQASFPRVLIVAAANSAATIVESYASADEGVYLTNSIVDVVIGDGARLQHFKVQRESPAAFHIATTQADLGANANYDTTAINLGGALARHTIDVVMDHEGAECSVDGLYMVDGNQHTDTHSLIDHRRPHCTSHQLYKGILDGKSRAVFNGKVFVRHDAQQTDAKQTNKNLLLSDDARVDTKPQLEIFADDVKCAHGAAVGQLAEDEIFYLESRGLKPDTARNLLTYGFAEEVIEKIKIESIKRELDAVVLNRLHAEIDA